MIMSVADAKKRIKGLSEKSDEEIESEILAVENVIRQYTNNNFQLRSARFSASSKRSSKVADESVEDDGINIVHDDIIDFIVDSADAEPTIETGSYNPETESSVPSSEDAVDWLHNGMYLNGSSPYIKAGDTIQISQSAVNDGIYTVSAVHGGKTYVTNGTLEPAPFNLVTKIVYPAGVINTAAVMLGWILNYRDKIGVKSESETLSRHSQSVTYEDSSGFVMGFPAGILSSLALYKKARF